MQRQPVLVVNVDGQHDGDDKLLENINNLFGESSSPSIEGPYKDV